MKKIIHTPDAPQPIGPYSQAVLINNILYASGQICIDPVTGNMNNENILHETQQVMKNIQAILHAAGMNFSHIVKTTIFLTDMNNFSKMNEVYASCFEKEFPARETVQVSRLPKDANVEISITATLL